MLHESFHQSMHNAHNAARRGDAAATERWLRIAERHVAITERRERLRPPRRANQPEAPKGPVMLDPKGFSPGGTPNWYLNMQRRERAGLSAVPE